MAGGLPLEGVRVVDMAGGRNGLCGRFLGDLGAEVILVEPPEGNRSRSLPPVVDGISTHFWVSNYNKQSLVLDLTTPESGDRLLNLLESVDIWLHSGGSAQLSGSGLEPAHVLDTLPHLVIVSISDFGQYGPYAGYQATDPVHLALAAVLSRSGLDGLPPLIPPGALSYQAAAFQAAWAALVGYWNRLEAGHGDHMDVSVFEATAQAIDPVMGTVGTARAGQSALQSGRGRPKRATYPIYPCRDGHVRVVVLAARQWRNLCGWLGDPSDLSDPVLETVSGRNAHVELIDAYLSRLLAGLTVDQVVAEGQRRGVPLAPVLELAEVLKADHFEARASIVEHDVAPGVRAGIPSGLVEIDGKRIGIRRPAPPIGAHDGDLIDERRRSTADEGTAPRRPFSGLRVVDFGVIVIGAEISRLFADLGAEVIRIENRAYPDGARAAIPGRMSAAFAVGQRNKTSLGVNLRTEEGVALVKELISTADLVLENFKPGTLESLGLGWDVLHAVNPKLVMSSSSAMGSDGPWSSWMGYGPLVRASSGLTSIWRYPDVDNSFSDGTTILPDHLGARLVAAAVLAALVRSRRTGQGVHVESAQSEVILGLLSELLAAESLVPGAGFANRGLEESVPWGVFPCAGDDEWCVVTIRDDTDWTRLADVIGDPPLDIRTLASGQDRRRHRNPLEKWVAAWTSCRSPQEVQSLLQGAGVPAAAMQRPPDLLADPHLRARDFFRVLDQPWLTEPVPTENGPFLSRYVVEPDMRPAPLMGQQTRDICERILGMTPEKIEDLIVRGVLEEDQP